MLGRATIILVYGSLVLFLTAIPVICGWLLFEWSLIAVVTSALFCGGTVSAILLHVLVDSSYLITERGIQVTASGVRKQVLFQSVVRVERVRHRVKSAVQEGVRIVYRQGADERRVLVRPENAMLFVHDIVSRCPQLTGFNQRKMPHLEHLDSNAEAESKGNLVCICA